MTDLKEGALENADVQRANLPRSSHALSRTGHCLPQIKTPMAYNQGERNSLGQGLHLARVRLESNQRRTGFEADFFEALFGGLIFRFFSLM